jgi:hypothetical protein
VLDYLPDLPHGSVHQGREQTQNRRRFQL